MESGLTEFHGGLPKSPMRDRFLDDLVKNPGMASRDVSRSPFRERGGSDDFDRDGVDLAARSSNVSKSPMRGRGTTPMSMRTRDVSKSPLREDGSLGGFADVGRSTTRSMNEDVEGNTKQERVAKMTAKNSFDVWLPDDTRDGRSVDNNAGGRRSVWRDRSLDRPDQISEGVKSVVSDEHDLTSERSFDDQSGGIGRNDGGMYRDGRFRSADIGRRARPNVVDGPSSYRPNPNHGYGDPRHSFESGRGPASVQESHLQRAELLRKYKELGDQLSVLDDAEVFSPRYSEPDGRSVDESSRLRHGPVKQFPPDRNFQRPSHFSRGPGLAHNQENMYDFNQPVYKDQFAGQMKRGPHPNQHHDPRDSYVSRSNDSQGRDQYNSLAHRRQGHSATNLTSSYDMAHERYGPQTHDPTKMAHTGPRARSSHPVHQHKRFQVATLNKRLCRPISGGAPFVLCDNCFQLLILPGNVIAKRKKQQVQCGTCSTLISIDLQKKSSDPLSTQDKPDSVHEADVPSQVTNESATKHQRDSSVAASTNVGSYDFDAGGYSIHSMGSEASSGAKGHVVKSTLPENTVGLGSSPSRFSVDERNFDTQSVQSSQPNSSETPMMIRPPPGSPLHHRFVHSSQASEKQIIDKEIPLDDPVHVTDATETDVPFNELPTTGLSEDSDISRESSIVVQSHMDALLNGFAVLTRQGTPVRAEVYVNGQPIPRRLVREAEKLAGPIEPGDYWYDPKAGFWGVMGDRCLGIIPPFIEEFRFPMPEDCSRGDSKVFVNGRELQERDLNLLARRGLPTTRDMYYVVDISGKVVDEQTRDFVVNLGRLAPSVERNKRGFGMQVPELLDD
ncbi:hypothetical protein RND81_13G056100 [Saponaria officinalis]